ncbi:hypothetical protein [Streptomyces sp. NPDC048272]|uniref:hypothetical protein n=1 Tax=Streptomyces sp. NPDC048272 TaxID=3154616 RepID=UPI003427DEB4
MKDEEYRDIVIVKSEPDQDGTVRAISGRYNGKKIRVALDKLQPVPPPFRAEGEITERRTVTYHTNHEATRNPLIHHVAPTSDMDIQVVTVEGTAYGPYVGLPLSPLACPSDPLLFTRATAAQILRDLLIHDAECGMTGEFSIDGTLTFTWTAAYGGRAGAGTKQIRPDAHGRYAIGGLWMWCPWWECTNDLPFTAGQAAFATGASQYRQADDSAAHLEPLDALYVRGRQEAYAVSLRADADAPADKPAALVDLPMPGLQIHPAIEPGGAWRVTFGRLSGLGPTLMAAKAHLAHQVLAATLAATDEPVFARTGKGNVAVALPRPGGTDYYQSNGSVHWGTARFVGLTPEQVIDHDNGAMPLPYRYPRV